MTETTKKACEDALHGFRTVMGSAGVEKAIQQGPHAFAKRMIMYMESVSASGVPSLYSPEQERIIRQELESGEADQYIAGLLGLC